MDDHLDTVESRARYYATTAALSFLAEANSIIERSKDSHKAKGLNDQKSLVISFACRAVATTTALAIGSAIGGPAGAMAGAKVGNAGGGVAASALKATFSYYFKIKDHKQCKHLHKKYFTSFKPNERLPDLVAFFYDVFTNYNIQFYGMIRNLKDSWENAMNKMALDTVDRLFDGMISSLDDQGPNMTNCLSEALIQFLLGSSSGRTIEITEGKKIDTTKLFTRPYEIKDKKDILKCLNEGINSKYFYRYSFEMTESLTGDIQKSLAKKLDEDLNITDKYETLRVKKRSLVKGIVDDCKFEVQKIIEKLEEIFERQIEDHAEIKRGIEEIKNHERHSIVLIGDTGVGKSTIASYLSNTSNSDTFKVSHNSTVTTNDVHHKEFKVFKGLEAERKMNTTLQILDCPGLGNTAKDKDGNRLTDDHVLKLISQSVRNNCRGGVSAFILVLDSSEEVVYDTIVKYIEKFSPKIFTKNLIIINNRATLQNHTMEQFCQVFYDFLNQEYADESMKNDLKRQVREIPKVDIGRLDESVLNSVTPDEQFVKLIQLIRKKGASKYFPE